MMYDSVNAHGIPKTALIIAGYIDGKFAWTPEEWAMFDGYPHLEVRIACFASTDDGRVLDVEKGDATPDEAPQWVQGRRNSKAHPLGGPACIYTNASTWPYVVGAFHRQGVQLPDFWIAQWDGRAKVPFGAVAKQFQSFPTYDTSVCLPTWPEPHDPLSVVES